MIGNRYGSLTVRERAGSDRGNSCWLCDCDCGGTKLGRADRLKSGALTTCGECSKRYGSPANTVTLVPGETFGALTVLQGPPNRGPGGGLMWPVLCSCGVFKSVLGSQLRSGLAVSCGNRSIHVLVPRCDRAGHERRPDGKCRQCVAAARAEIVAARQLRDLYGDLLDEC